MTLAAEDRSAAAPVRLSCDRRGWILSRPGAPSSLFGDFDAALDSARAMSAARASMIEIWQDGEYICCLQPDARGLIRRPPPQGDGLALVERYANRIAQLLLPAAGLFFWLALLVVALAASLGWRLALL